MYPSVVCNYVTYSVQISSPVSANMLNAEMCSPDCGA